MSLNVVAHLNFRGEAREALSFYHAIFGGDVTIVTYADMHGSHNPADADRVMWGQVQSPGGFTLMAYDVQSDRTFERGDRSFYLALRGNAEDEIRTSWNGLADGGTVLQPLEPSPFAVLYGMVTDRFGITWIVDVAKEPATA